MKDGLAAELSRETCNGVSAFCMIFASSNLKKTIIYTAKAWIVFHLINKKKKLMIINDLGGGQIEKKEIGCPSPGKNIFVRAPSGPRKFFS